MKNSYSDIGAAARGSDIACRKELRKEFLKKRAGLSPENAAKRSEDAVPNIVSLPEFKNAATVLIYSHVKNELSLDSLLTRPESAGKRFAFPLCTSRTEMKAMIPGAWRKGLYDIPEPDPGSPGAHAENRFPFLRNMLYSGKRFPNHTVKVSEPDGY